MSDALFFGSILAGLAALFAGGIALLTINERFHGAERAFMVAMAIAILVVSVIGMIFAVAFWGED